MCVKIDVGKESIKINLMGGGEKFEVAKKNRGGGVRGWNPNHTTTFDLCKKYIPTIQKHSIQSKYHR